MRTLTYFVATSLDGFIADPKGGFGDFLFEGDHMTALVEEYPDTLPAQAREAMGIDAPNQHFDTILMGRATYQVPGGLPSPYPHLRQYVVSTRLSTTPEDVQVVADPLAEVRELKEESDGLGIWLCGGGRLAAALLPEIDELVLKVHPIVLGKGIPLFAGDFPTARFAKASTRVFDSGVVFASYVKADVV
ncbi:dihydrofolate reductase family protein [Saccharothrix luteola]|uniref:dihydrofolate reductase family protein n=1 Tax=Saccharothrix luteola TaxID=2893018 RepID=UPI001E4E9160|nr:dihydrofolate reductase family protein [Saccharothrix luteola]MCC8250761.1 dihydrofolate reductase family protein [Saccharothrix luteola]